MLLPDIVLTFTVLEGALSLTENQPQMALALASDLKCESMMSALKIILFNKSQTTDTKNMISNLQNVFIKREDDINLA